MAKILLDGIISQFANINLASIKKEFDAIGETEPVDIIINTPGGSVTEAYAIHDYIKTQVPNQVSTISINAQSAGTIINQARTNGGKRKGTQNGEYMVHLPFGGVFGRSKEIREYAEDLERHEAKILAFHAANTTADIETLRALYSNENGINMSAALEHGFIDEIIEGETVTNSKAAKLEPIAFFNEEQEAEYFNAKNNKNKSLIMGALNDLKNEIVNLVKGNKANEVINETVSLKDGRTIEVDTQGREEDVAAVGDAVTLDGEQVGEDIFEAVDGRMIATDSSGVITEITEAEEEGETEEETETEAEAVEALRAELEAIRAELEETKAESKEIAELLRKNVKSLFTPPARQASAGTPPPMVEAKSESELIAEAQKLI